MTEKNEIIEEIVCRLERQLISKGGSTHPVLDKEEFFGFFAQAYNSGAIISDSLGQYIIERWDEKRLELLNQLTEAWDDWTYAWENVDKKSP